MKVIEYDRMVKDAARGAPREETEEQLIIEIKNIKTRMENSRLEAYHAIGTKISGFYGKNYGKNEMAKIAKTIDLSKSTVYKVVQFAEKYSWENIEEFSEGAFQLSWHRLRDNLSLEKKQVIRVYHASHNLSEFSRKIKQMKRLSNSNQESENDNGNGKSEIQEESEQFCPRVLNLPLEVSNKELSEKVTSLNAEITKLQSELEWKNREIESIQKVIEQKEIEWLKKFPEILRDLDSDALTSLESSLFEEKNRREIEGGIAEIHISTPHETVAHTAG